MSSNGLVGDSYNQLSKVAPLEHTHECSRRILETVNNVFSVKNRSIFQSGADLALEIWEQLGKVIDDEPRIVRLFERTCRMVAGSRSGPGGTG
jgi:hypothetical protein